MENLIYYPYISIPKSDWSIRTLLYYDTIGAIVPYRYTYNKDNYEPFMRELVDSKLVVPIDPLGSLDRPRDVAKAFVVYMKSKQFRLRKRLTSFRKGVSGGIHADKFRKNDTKIHTDKFDQDLFYELEHAGLAKPQKNGEWFTVENKTADDLMTYIASILGVKMNYLPATDELKRNSFRAIGIKKKDYKIYKSAKGKRELVLEKLIPFPEQIDIGMIRSFKDKNRDLLNAFKNKVELIALNPGIEADSDLFEETIRELDFRKKELSAKMGESNLPNRFVSLSAVAGALAGLETHTAVGVAFTVFSLAGAIVSALRFEKPGHIFDQSGLKYLALVDKQLRRRPSNL